MKKFKFLVGYGLKKRVFRKSFLIANIIIAILFVAIVNIPTIIGWFASDEDEVTQVYIDVYNETSISTIDNNLEVVLNQYFGVEDYFIVSNATETLDKEKFWENEDKDISIVISGDVNQPEIEVFSKFSKENEINKALESQLELLIINHQIIDYQSPSYKLEMAPDYDDPEQGAMISSLMSLLVLPLFILITMATQFVGVDIIEEKSTKAIETIIASVPAKIHFLSKISSSILFVMIQGGLILVYGGIAALIGNVSASTQTGLTGGIDPHLLTYLSEFLPNWRVVIAIVLLFVIVGTLFYLVIAALFASMAVTQEDYQQFQSPLMLMLLGGFYIGIFAPMAGGEGFMKIMAFVPMFTPMVAPIAFATGIMSLTEALVALAIMILVLIGSLYVVAPVYKIAILSYDQTKFFKRTISYFKKAFTKNGKKDKSKLQ